MMYAYMTLPDETEIVHSHLLDHNGVKSVEVHFERPKNLGFDSARCVLPTYEWIIRDGFTDAEIAFFEEFLRHNAHLLFKYAEAGGLQSA